jgi:hypothetical protein
VLAVVHSVRCLGKTVLCALLGKTVTRRCLGKIVTLCCLERRSSGYAGRRQFTLCAAWGGQRKKACRGSHQTTKARRASSHKSEAVSFQTWTDSFDLRTCVHYARWWCGTDAGGRSVGSERGVDNPNLFCDAISIPTTFYMFYLLRQDQYDDCLSHAGNYSALCEVGTVSEQAAARARSKLCTPGWNDRHTCPRCTTYDCSYLSVRQQTQLWISAEIKKACSAQQNSG